MSQAIAPLGGTSSLSTCTGRLRAIDLDHRSFILRNAEDVTQTPCEFPEEMLEAAKEGLGKRVRVTGTKEVDARRRSAARLVVTNLEILGDEPQG